MVQHKRSTMDILTDILRQDRVTKTSMRLAAAMNYAQTSKYLAFLLEKNFLVAEKAKNGVTVYIVTEKGKKLLALLDDVSRLLHGEQTRRGARELVESSSRT